MGVKEVVPSSSDRNWLEWVTAARAGDRDALRRLYSIVQSHVGHVLLALGGNRPGLEDLGNDICADVLVNLHRYTREGSFRAWVGIATAWQYRRWLRTQTRRDWMDADAGCVGAAASDRPDDVLERQEVVRGIDAAMKRLPRRLLACFTLVYLQGDSPAEAAKTIGGNPREITNSAYRARLLLRQELTHMGLSQPPAKPAPDAGSPVGGAPRPAPVPIGCTQGGGVDDER